MKLLCITASALALALLSASSAWAAEELNIKTDQTQLITVLGDPGTVIIGNPSIADATVHGSKIFLHGRAFGTTNLIILDGEGNQISAFDLTVYNNNSNSVVLFKAGNRYTYGCAPLCETTMQVGDDFSWTSEIIKTSEKKLDLATGKSSAASAAPPASSQ